MERKAPVARKPKAGPNRRISAKESEVKLRSRTYTPQHAPLMLPVTTLYLVIAVMLLLPATIVTARALYQMLSGGVDGSFWFSPAFWHFTLGAVLAGGWFLGLPRPVWLYVWGHEMTHAICVLLCGGTVRDFKVDSTGGHVMTDRNNILIALSPYFVPFYSTLVLLAFLICGQFIDMTRHYPLPWGGSFSAMYVLFAAIGVTWSFHLCFTIWMIGKDQPDLRINGAFFSFVLILLINLLVLAGLLIIAAPGYGPGHFASLWLNTASEFLHAIWELITVAGG